MLLALDAWPTGCRQDDNCNRPTAEILLGLEVLVSGYENFKSCLLSSIKQVAVQQISPTSLKSCLDRVSSQCLSQGHRSALVEENPHLPSGDFGKASTGVFQDRFDLLALHTGEPCEKIF
jgi:hypothetical protein